MSLVFMFLLKLFLVKCLYIPKGASKNETAEEIQNALCTITTKGLEASANATITRQLKGVCTTSELNFRLDKLQTKILQEIDGIRYILEVNGFKVPEVSVKATETQFSSNPDEENSTKADYRTVRQRKDEILMYNNTVLDTADGRKFFYYWEVENIRQLLRKTDMYKSSPIFRVLGHNIRLQLYPNHQRRHYLGIGLRPDSPGFLKKHKIAILNILHPGLDIESDMLYGLNDKKLFRLRSKSLEYEGFIVEGSLVVKVEIYLNS